MPTNISASVTDADLDIKASQGRLKVLQDQLAAAGGRKRRELVPEIAAAQSELDLAEARGEALHTLQQFESGNFHQEAGANAAGSRVRSKNWRIRFPTRSAMPNRPLPAQPRRRLPISRAD